MVSTGWPRPPAGHRLAQPRPMVNPILSARVEALIARAHRDVWSPRTDIDWWGHGPVVPEGYTPARYVDTISQLFHAEQAALAIAGAARSASAIRRPRPSWPRRSRPKTATPRCCAATWSASATWRRSIRTWPSRTRARARGPGRRGWRWLRSTCCSPTNSCRCTTVGSRAGAARCCGRSTPAHRPRRRAARGVRPRVPRARAAAGRRRRARRRPGLARRALDPGHRRGARAHAAHGRCAASRSQRARGDGRARDRSLPPPGPDGRHPGVRVSRAAGVTAAAPATRPSACASSP